MAVIGNVVKTLAQQGKINPQPWVYENTKYLTVMGSVAYGVSTDLSDLDVYGFTIPPKDMVFPHLKGEIHGFGRQVQRFEQYQKHHATLDDPRGADHAKSVDMTVYSIVKYFQLCMECNPNMIDSMFTPARCVLVNTKVGEIMRENRKLFLSKKAWHSFKGYAFAQLAKASAKREGLEKYWTSCDRYGLPRDTPFAALDTEFSRRAGGGVEVDFKGLGMQDLGELRALARRAASGKRVEAIIKHGWDVKFGYHVVRLVLEVEQILADGDLELDRKSAREHMKAVRAGDFSLEEIKKWFHAKEKSLGELYTTSTLRHSPDEEMIKKVLLCCLEEHFGNLSAVVVQPGKQTQALRQIMEIARGAV